MHKVLTALLTTAVGASAALAADMTLNEADRRAEAIMDEATPATAAAIDQLQLPEGVTARLWAAEPMLANPVAFDFDEQGRLFVAETYRYGTSVLDIRGYMAMLEQDMAWRTIEDRDAGTRALFGEAADELAIESERIRLLIDEDGDGVADTSSEYAAGFDSLLDGIASGVLARQESLWLTNIPSLWKLGGISDAGTAETREEVLRGFGVHFNFTGHDLHGLAVGPDGKLYFSVGDRGASVTGPDGSQVDLPDTGAVFRVNFDGTGLEAVHTGLRNPQELAFDALGNLFTGDNDGDFGDFERLVQIAEGGDSGWRIGHQHAPLGGGGVWMSEGWWKTDSEERARFALPPLFYTEDGPSGIAFHPGTGLSPAWRDHLFVTHFRGNTVSSGVFTYTLVPDGAGHRLGEKTAFVTGLLPTDVTFGPDGSLYVLDWVDGWPKSNRGRVWALSHEDMARDPQLPVTRQLVTEGMTGRDDGELARLLAHPNWHVRLEAQLELAGRGASSVGLFRDLAGDPGSGLHARLHATWGLGVLTETGAPGAAEAVTALLRSDTAEVRAQAARLVGDHRIGGNVQHLVAGLEDASARVRYFSAIALGRLGDPDTAPALLEAARSNDDQDKYLAHAIVMGLAGTADAAMLERAAEDDARAVRFAALLALRRQGDAGVATFLDDGDRLVALEAARAINDTPIEAAFPALAAALDGEFANDPVLARRAINAHLRLGQPGNAQALARFIADEARPEDLRLEALHQLGTWPDPFDRDRLIGVYRPLAARDAAPARAALAGEADGLLASDNGTVLARFIETADTLAVADLEDRLVALVRDPDAAGVARAAAFESLVNRDDPRVDEMLELAGASDVPELRLAALPVITERSPDRARITLALMAQGSAEEQRIAYDTLGGSEQPFAAELLAASVDRLASGAVPATAQLELLEATDEHADPAVRAARERYAEIVAKDPDPVAAYRFALEGGDVGAGWGLYYDNPAIPCVRCHVVNGDAEGAGPNLATVGERLDRHALLEAMVAPNATIAEGYTSPSSMPDIFRDGLSRTQLRDLVAMMASLQGREEERGAHGD